MPFNIADFNAAISKSSIAQTSHFEGMIVGGPGTYSKSGKIRPNALGRSGVESGMRFRIESVNLPGRTLVTLDQNYNGPVRALPYRFNVQPVSMSIILSKDMREREAFMKWQDFFIGHYRTGDGTGFPGFFDTRYYEEGIGRIQILQYSYPLADARGNTSGAEYELQTTVTLHEAFPISVNDIQMAWTDEGYAKLQVEIRYRYATELNKNFGSQADFNNNKNVKDYNIFVKNNPGSFGQ
jgi:hypothetical protein